MVYADASLLVPLSQLLRAVCDSEIVVGLCAHKRLSWVWFIQHDMALYWALVQYPFL